MDADGGDDGDDAPETANVEAAGNDTPDPEPQAS